MNAPVTRRMIPGTAWWTCSPDSETLSLNGPRPARIIRVITRVTTNVTMNAEKQSTRGSREAPMLSAPSAATTDDIVRSGFHDEPRGLEMGIDARRADGTFRTHFRTCPLCEAMCGLEIRTEGDRVTRVRGDRDDVWSKGYICPKGAALGHLHHDPDRLRVPMVRDGDRWREVSWAEAFARCEELLHPVVERYGIAAVTAYIGNPAVHNYSLSRYTGAVAGIPRMPVVWSAGTVDQWPKNLACAQLFGNPWSIPVPDIHRTDLFLVMGANPQASQGSLFSCPDILGEIKHI